MRRARSQVIRTDQPSAVAPVRDAPAVPLPAAVLLALLVGGGWALPAALVLLDATQTRFPLGGFPLPALVLGQLDSPFALAAPLGGSLLVTAAAATVGVGLGALLLTTGRARLGAVGTGSSRHRGRARHRGGGAQLRALEFGRAVLQSAPTGYSVIVLPTGEVAARSGLGDPALLRETVPLRTGLTPYARTGDLPVLSLAVHALLLGPARRATRTAR